MKKVLSILLLVCLLIGILPGGVWAAESETPEAEKPESLLEEIVPEPEVIDDPVAEEEPDTAPETVPEDTDADETEDEPDESGSTDETESPEITEADTLLVMDLSDQLLLGGGFEMLPCEGAFSQDAYEAVCQIIGDNRRKYNDQDDKEISIDLSGWKLTEQDVMDLFSAILNKNPEFYYISTRYSYSYPNASGYVNTIYLRYVDAFPADSDDRFASVVNSILTEAQKLATPLEMALYIHDYIVTHCEYDDSNEDTCYTAYGCLVQNRAVCQGYAQAYAYLLNQCGVPADTVSSDDMNHAWNLVTLDGLQYFVDSTWDDRDSYEAYCSHKNFLRSADGLQQTGHSGTDWANSSAVSVMTVTDTKYDSWFWLSMAPSPFAYYNGSWYGVTNNRTVCSLTPAEEAGSLASVSVSGSSPLQWPVLGTDGNETNYIYANCYGTLAVYNDALYLSGPDTLYTLSENGFEAVYSLTDEKAYGRIYGILTTEPGLQCTVQPGPDDQTRQLTLLYSDTSTISGEDESWTLDEVGTLTVYNNSAMEYTTCPWSEWEDSIRAVVIEDGVTVIHDGAFHGCSHLTTVTFGEDVTEIGSYAFAGCRITEIELPASLQTIGVSAFRNCLCVESVTLPASVTSIGISAFNGCTALTSVTFAGTGTISIGSYAFRSCTSLTDITLPAGLGKLGYGTFYGCTALASVTFPENMTEIGNYAFYNCTALNNVVLPDTVTSIGKYAFSKCAALASVDFSDCSVSIGESAFCYSGLTSVTLPSTVKISGNYAFYGCTNLVSVTIFADISDNENETYWYTFRGCTSLTSLTISEGVRELGVATFSGCTALASVRIPDSMTYIGQQLFDGCTGLTSVTIPSSVKYVYWYAFRNCNKLANVYYTGTNDQWGSVEDAISNYNLYGNDSLLTATIHCLGDDNSTISVTSGTIVSSCSVTTYGDTATVDTRTVGSGGSYTIALSDLQSVATDNSATSVTVTSGMGATGSVGGTAAPQTSIVDENGNTVFAAQALGAQLRYDKKMSSDTDLFGTYSSTGDKATASDYIDLRLRYVLTLPEGVTPDSGNVTWGWTLRFNGKTLTVNGAKYSSLGSNTYASNLVVQNVPLTYSGQTFTATLTLSYTKNNVTYTLEQTDDMPLTRTVREVVDYYSDNSGGLSTMAANYVGKLKELIR